MIYYTIVASVLLLYALYRFSPLSKSSALPLPPGPPTSWYGSVALPQLYPWITYAQWKETYGDLIYIYVFGNPILVLNSATAASDLLEKRGGNYSSRPLRTMVVELIGWDWLFSSMVYGNSWKRHRNLFYKHFRPNGSSQHSLQLTETRTLLRSLLQSPDHFRYHVRRTAAAIILNVVYGQQVAEEGDEFVTLADKALAGLSQAGIFGTYLVDYVPLLKNVPAWFPGATFKRQALEWRKVTREMVNRPFDMIKQRMNIGTATDCLVTQELDKRSLGYDYEDENIIKNVAATSFAAGSDTVVSTILSLFLVMTLHPDIQKMAQNELDDVVGNRLPNFSDKEQLPLITSICYELLRWNPVAPLGLAHYVSKDDEYRGYCIPKGTTIIPNVWAILHDPSVYPDPLVFNPSRFVDREKNALASINDIPDAAFGFGRRICPGRWFALDSLFIAVASILAVYDISPALDEHGEPALPKVEYASSLLSHPKPFKCFIVPRSQKARELIQQIEIYA